GAVLVIPQASNSVAAAPWTPSEDHFGTKRQRLRMPSFRRGCNLLNGATRCRCQFALPGALSLVDLLARSSSPFARKVVSQNVHGTTFGLDAGASHENLSHRRSWGQLPV